MLATKSSAGVAPEVIWGIHCTQVMKHASEGIHPGFGTQGRHHQKSKTMISMALQKGLDVLQVFIKKSNNLSRIDPERNIN